MKINNNYNSQTFSALKITEKGFNLKALRQFMVEQHRHNGSRVIAEYLTTPKGLETLEKTTVYVDDVVFQDKIVRWLEARRVPYELSDIEPENLANFHAMG